MYKIRVRYGLTTYGETWAEIICEEADENFNDAVLFWRRWDDRYLTACYQSWEEVEQRVTEVLEDVRAEIARRRALAATRPPERIVEL